MKTTIYESDFTHNPMLESNFTYHARVALFEHLEQLEEDLGEQWDFDPIAIRCDFTEYANIQEFWQDYDRYTYQCMNDIEDNTSVIYIQNSESFIIQNF
jgi:hypothetical protein